MPKRFLFSLCFSLAIASPCIAQSPNGGMIRQPAANTRTSQPPNSNGYGAPANQGSQPTAGIGQPAGSGGVPGRESGLQDMNPPARPPLPPEIQAKIRLWLDHWQAKTDGIQRYSCRFVRYQYNPTNLGGNHPYSVSEGEIRYMKPDKGLFKVEVFKAGQVNAQGMVDYLEANNRFGEWWICDGKAVYEFNRNENEALEFELPPTMQGLQIADSPLPFVFGIKAEKVLERYWIEPGQRPNGRDGQPRMDLVALEAYPKRLEDSLNYQRVIIYLNVNTTLPEQMVIVAPDSKENAPVYDQYEFSKQEVNANFLDKVKEMVFMKSFIPEPPKNFKIIKRPYQEPSDQPLQAQGQFGPGGAGVPGDQRLAQPPSRVGAPR